MICTPKVGQTFGVHIISPMAFICFLFFHAGGIRWE